MQLKYVTDVQREMNKRFKQAAQNMTKKGTYVTTYKSDSAVGPFDVPYGIKPEWFVDHPDHPTAIKLYQNIDDPEVRHYKKLSKLIKHENYKYLNFIVKAKDARLSGVDINLSLKYEYALAFKTKQKELKKNIFYIKVTDNLLEYTVITSSGTTVTSTISEKNLGCKLDSSLNLTHIGLHAKRILEVAAIRGHISRVKSFLFLSVHISNPKLITQIAENDFNYDESKRPAQISQRIGEIEKLIQEQTKNNTKISTIDKVTNWLTPPNPDNSSKVLLKKNPNTEKNFLSKFTNLLSSEPKISVENLLEEQRLLQDSLKYVDRNNTSLLNTIKEFINSDFKKLSKETQAIIMAMEVDDYFMHKTSRLFYSQFNNLFFTKKENNAINHCEAAATTEYLLSLGRS